MIALVALDIANAATLRHGPVRGAEHAFICPRHDDQNPSLKINAKKNCWMCAPCRKAGNAWALAAFLAGVAPGDKRAIAAWLHEHGFTRDAPKNDSPQGKDELKNGRKRIVAAYAYVDESNQLLYQVVRFDPKSFGQRRPDGKGGWVWNIEGVRRVLYRLPEVLTAHEIFVVEGEKDADNLSGLGVSETCNHRGAGK